MLTQAVDLLISKAGENKTITKAIIEYSLEKIDEDKSWDWYRDNVGAKWAHIDDGADDYINIVSAWSPVSEFCMKLVEFLSLTDPNVLLRHQYEDEFRNFVGIQIFWAENEEADCDHEQIEDTDITESFRFNLGTTF